MYRLAYEMLDALMLIPELHNNHNVNQNSLSINNLTSNDQSNSYYGPRLIVLSIIKFLSISK